MASAERITPSTVLPMAAMGSDGVAVVEVPIVRRQRAAILKAECVRIYSAHLHQFAIRGAEISIPRLPVSSSRSPGATSIDRCSWTEKESRLRWSECPFLAAHTAGYDCLRFHAANCQRFMLIHSPCGPMNQDNVSLAIFGQIAQRGSGSEP